MPANPLWSVVVRIDGDHAIFFNPPSRPESPKIQQVQLAHKSSASIKKSLGVGSNGEQFVMHRYGEERPANGLKPSKGGKLWLRVRNDRHIVTFHTSRDGRRWQKYPVQMEVSGYHHNVAGRFLALKPALYAAGDGAVTFRRFSYRALD